MILLSDDAVSSIYSSIPGSKLDNDAGGWVLPTSSSPPTLGFSVAGTFYNIPGEDLKFADAGDGMSFGSVQSRGSGIGQDILGDVSLSPFCLLRVSASWTLSERVRTALLDTDGLAVHTGILEACVRSI